MPNVCEIEDIHVCIHARDVSLASAASLPVYCVWRDTTQPGESLFTVEEAFSIRGSMHDFARPLIPPSELSIKLRLIQTIYTHTGYDTNRKTMLISDRVLVFNAKLGSDIFR